MTYVCLGCNKQETTKFNDISTVHCAVTGKCEKIMVISLAMPESTNGIANLEIVR